MPFTPTHLAAVGGRKVTPALDQVSQLAWSYPLDPVEVQPFTVDWATELQATGAIISSAEWTLPSTAAAGGLTNLATTANRTEATIWLSIAEASQSSVLYTDPGIEYLITLKITDSISRVYRRTITLTVKSR